MMNPDCCCAICGVPLRDKRHKTEGCRIETLRGIDAAHTRANNGNDGAIYEDKRPFGQRLYEAELMEFGEFR